VAAWLLAGAAHGQPAPEPAAPSTPPIDTQTILSGILVKGERFQPEESGFTANVVEQAEIRERHLSRMQDMFHAVPGMSVNELGLGGVGDNIVMRGFGNGGHGGDIGMVIDGIPLNEAMSHADGYVDQNVIIPLELERMTVYKGPSSALYGNYNRGGTIAFESRKGGDYRELDVMAGSFSTLDVQGALGVPLSESTEGNFAVHFFDTNGFRQQSDNRYGTFSGRVGFKLGGDTTLALSGRAHQGRWDSASYISAAQFDSGRRFDKDPRVQNDGGEKDFYTGRIDLSTPVAEGIDLLAYAYATQQTFVRAFTRPISPTVTPWRQREEDYDRDVYGLGTSLNGLNTLAGKKINWVVGAEMADESTHYQYRDALNNLANTPATTDGTVPYLDRDYDSRSASVYGQAEWGIAPLFRPIVGLRHDRLTGDCSAKPGEILGGTACQKMTTYTHTSPKIGIRSTWSPGLDTRISYAEGFQLPPQDARYGAGGGLLDPTELRQTEAGLTLRPLAGLFIDTALFRIDTTNEVRNLGGGVYENFGETRRQGIELDLSYAVAHNFDLSAGLTWMNTKVLENADPAVAGRAVPGVAKRTATLRGIYRFDNGLSTDLRLYRNSGYPVSADGTASLRGYSVADLTLAYEYRLWGRNQRIHLSAANLTDRKYATNSFMMGGQQMYAPAAPRSFMLGVNLDL
jgi:outer membrane receptor protein involved in Fe transport